MKTVELLERPSELFEVAFAPDESEYTLNIVGGLPKCREPKLGHANLLTGDASGRRATRPKPMVQRPISKRYRDASGCHPCCPCGRCDCDFSFQLGFHDALHQLPVVRQAAIASSFGLRFQGLGYFLMDARTHRGISGAPVVMRSPSTNAQLPWKLLGVHSARMDMGSRDLQLDETLGLNCAWYADILLTLTT
jgi:hypothetical protein